MPSLIDEEVGGSLRELSAVQLSTRLTSDSEDEVQLLSLDVGSRRHRLGRAKYALAGLATLGLAVCALWSSGSAPKLQRLLVQASTREEEIPAATQPPAAPPAPAAPAAPQPPAPPAGVPPLQDTGCSWEGEDCTNTKCCKRQGFKCFKQDEKWAGCGDTCENMMKYNPGTTWDCSVLGESYQLPAVTPAAGAAAGTTLFCFVVVTQEGVTAPGVKPGYETQVIDAIKPHKAGIFGCDDHAIYSGQRVTTGDWKSVVNTDIFLTVWDQVLQEGAYKNFDWTVKVDVDCVFFPDRLKQHLAAAKPPADTAMYFKNIDFKFGFMGSLEVLSKKAVDVLLAGKEQCHDHIGSSGGEDFFTMQCLDALGVGHMTDTSLLDDKYTHGEGWHLFDVDPCKDASHVAYHPYKAVNSWMGCFDIATGVMQTNVFVGCNARFPDDACSLGSQLSHTNGGLGVPQM
jgi:hypothetical protein